jgi:hypothetical protein
MAEDIYHIMGLPAKQKNIIKSRKPKKVYKSSIAKSVQNGPKRTQKKFDLKKFL